MVKKIQQIRLACATFATTLCQTLTGAPKTLAQDALVSFKVLSPESALKAAQAALDSCRAEGSQVSIVTVDQIGVARVLIRDRVAGPHTREASQLLKAHTNENRLMLLCILSETDYSVAELETLLEIRQPTLHQQLARRRADGLVTTRHDGKAISYSLASEKIREKMELVH